MTDICNDIHICIVHYYKMHKRKLYLEYALKKQGINNVIFFDEIRRDTLSEKHLSNYKYSPENWMKYNSLWHMYESKPRQLTLSEIACQNTHIAIYDYIINNNLKYCIIFEDDTILYNNFKDNLIKIINDLPDDFDACFIDDSFGWTVENYRSEKMKGYLPSLNMNKLEDIKNQQNKYVYKMPSGKCAAAYIISKKGAQILKNELIPFCLPIDWMQTYVFLHKNMNIYWSHPPIVHQGSLDVYVSTADRPEDANLAISNVNNKCKYTTLVDFMMTNKIYDLN